MQSVEIISRLNTAYKVGLHIIFLHIDSMLKQNNGFSRVIILAVSNSKWLICGHYLILVIYTC